MDLNISYHRLDIVGGFRIFLADLKWVITTILGYILAGFRLLGFLLLSFWKFFLFFGIMWIIWYMIILFWPYFMELVILVGIPIANILIVLFNVFFAIAVVILSILIMIWNMLVPLIGMIITLIINVLVTVLAQVFQIIGAIDWEPIISAFMDILMPIVDIAMQILMVMIKVGPDIITAFANVVGELAEIVMMFVKVLVEIAAWVFQILYPILQPIVQIIGIFFGSIGQLFSARMLLSIDENQSFTLEEDIPINDYRSYVKQALGPDYERIGTPDTTDYLSMRLNAARRKEQTFHTTFGRKVLSKGRGGLEFVEEDEGPGMNIDDITYTMSRTMYNQAKKTPEAILDLAKVTLDRINAHNNDKTALNLKALLTEYHMNNGHFDINREDTLAAVRFSSTPEHPQQMSERFHQQREHVKRVVSGRKLLDITWDSKQEEYVSDMHIKHALDIIEQERIYKAHHFDRMRNATVIYGAATKAMKKTIEESGFDASTIVGIGGHVVERLGYKDIWHLYHDFMEKHGDPLTFMVSMSKISEQPLFKFFKEKHPVRPRETFFYDWSQMHLEMGSEEFSYAPNTGRFLMQAATGADKNLQSSGASKESVGSLAIFSPLDCRGELQNPLCIPEVPIDFRIDIPTIKLDKETERKLLKNVELCHPWEYSLALIDKWILWNAFQEFRFILSAFPPINYTVAMITVLMPWTGVLFDWMFMIPKFRTARIFQYICFVRHLYSIFVIVLIGFLLAIPLSFFWRPTVDAYRALITRYQKDKARNEERKERKLKKLERIWAKFEARKEARMSVDADMGSFVSGNIEHRHYIHLVDESKRRKLYNQDMRETYELTDGHDDIWHDMLHHVNRTDLQLDYPVTDTHHTLRLRHLIQSNIDELEDVDE